jgi:hypothetical protein
VLTDDCAPWKKIKGVGAEVTSDATTV